MVACRHTNNINNTKSRHNEKPQSRYHLYGEEDVAAKDKGYQGDR